MINTCNLSKFKTIVLLLGLALTGFSIYKIPTVWIKTEDIKTITGTLDTIYKNYYWNFTKTTRPPERIIKNQIVEIGFRLAGNHQEFYLREHTGKDGLDEEYEKIYQGLKNSDSIQVSIKRNQLNFRRPQVLQISNSEETLFDFKHLHLENNEIVIYTFIIGIVLILVFLLFQRQTKHQNKINYHYL